MKKFSEKVEIHWSEYEPYCGECVRFVAHIGNQYFVMEFERFDTNLYDNDVAIDWNVNMCIVNELTDEAIYTVSEEICTGKTPFATYPLAMRGLRELIRYMKQEYDESCDGKVHHRLYAHGTNDRRHKVYGRILEPMGWIEKRWDGFDCYMLTVEGK